MNTMPHCARGFVAAPRAWARPEGAAPDLCSQSHSKLSTSVPSSSC